MNSFNEIEINGKKINLNELSIAPAVLFHDLNKQVRRYCQESCANLISYKPPGVLIPGRTGAVKIAAHLS